MKWQGRRQSSNVDDRRGSGGGRGGRNLGIAGLVIIAAITLLSGGDLGDVIRNTMSTGGPPAIEQQHTPTAQEQELAEFVKVVFADTEDVWNQIFKDYGKTYNEPMLVLFSGSVNSGCGYASAQTGPFYCSADNSIYIDLSFYNDLKNRFGASGDFAMAYVVAHEVGHHVQNELGILDQVRAQQQKVSKTQGNELNVRLELQADYLAGVWANRIEGMGYLERGDIEEAMTAANAIGDDTIQKEAQGYVVPDSFTHGTSEQRTRWLMKGFKAGDLSEWDSFAANPL